MNKINIVMATDKNYIIQTRVTISSLLSHTPKSTFLQMSILSSKDLDNKSRASLHELAENNNQIEINFLEVQDEGLSKATTTAHVSLASYYRLYISQLLHVDKCLYIDGDMIIHEDLTEVYNTNIDGYYIAGVKDAGMQYNWEESKEYANYLQIPTVAEYVNAGFLLLNLKKIREDKIDCQMIEAIKHGYKFMDQDILNKFCYGKIKILPLKYNYFAEFYGIIHKRNSIGYTNEELEEIKQGVAIFHYAGRFKPWLCTRLKANQIWWEEAAKTLEKEVYERILNEAKDFEEKSDWKYLYDTVQKEENVVVFGYSEIGKSVAEKLLSQNVKGIVAFADNDKSKEGSHYNLIPVLSAKQVSQKYKNALFIITSQNAFPQIKTQLEKLGIKSERIIRYIFKNEEYYVGLDERFEE